MYADDSVIFLLSLLAEWCERYLATQLCCHVCILDVIYIMCFHWWGYWSCGGLPVFNICHIIGKVSYLCVRRTGIATSKSCVAGCVLQAKTGFMSLSHFTSGNDIQQVVVTEGVHAVVVPLWNSREPAEIEVLYILLSNYSCDIPFKIISHCWFIAKMSLWWY